MKKKIIVMCCVLMFAQIGFARDKIGVVDIQQIVNNSCEVHALKQEHLKQIEELNKIVDNAQKAIAQENDPQKIISLQDRFTCEFNQKKSEIDKQYEIKMQLIESRLKNNIMECAKKHDYDYVFAKNTVFYGGDDITDMINK